MYKVFINNKRLILANSQEKIDFGTAAVICLKNPETVNTVVQNHLLDSDSLDLIILSTDDKKLINEFEAKYELRIAAGGWVWNEKEELLMIFREDHWDIPKGHLDEGEDLHTCAIREVIEETGIKEVFIDTKLGISRHTYKYKGSDVLKITHWYKMHSSSKEVLKPQTEEGINKVEWVAKSDVKRLLQSSWRSISELYNEFTIS